MPGFLAWAVLTIKESWLIFFEITIFFMVWRFWRTKNLLYALIALALILVTHSFRFYVAYICVAALFTSLMCYGSKRPFLTLAGAASVVLMTAVALNFLGVVSFNASGVIESRMAEVEGFRKGLSSVASGAHTTVRVDYDFRTPAGALMVVLTGSTYLLLAPFPWEMLVGRQIYALPDVLMWWTLVFGFIMPGMIYVWKTRASLLVSVLAFTLPLILFYSLIFGNVGLAYRQRAQIMPFLLVLAAAGYESRRQRAREKQNAQNGVRFDLLQAGLKSAPRLASMRQPTQSLRS
jgi:hypothetical protein